MTRKEKMFELIATAVKDLEKRGGVTEDIATGKVLDGLKASPKEMVMDLDVLPLLLLTIIDLELGLI
jgi:hypothetical protein